MYVCMYACMHACMHACVHACATTTSVNSMCRTHALLRNLNTGFTSWVQMYMFNMFITAVCFVFFIKLQWLKNKSV